MPSGYLPDIRPPGYGVQKPKIQLTDKQYHVLSELFHEVSEAFEALPLEWKLAHGRKLRERALPLRRPKSEAYRDSLYPKDFGK